MIFNIGDEFIYRPGDIKSGHTYKYVITLIDSDGLHMDMYNITKEIDSSHPYHTRHEIQSFIDNINSGKVEIVYNLNLDFTIRHEEIL